jgi:hypothetical protein
MISSLRIIQFYLWYSNFSKHMNNDSRLSAKCKQERHLIFMSNRNKKATSLKALPHRTRGGHLGVQRIQDVPRSVWVKTDGASVCVFSTDVAFAVLLAASVFTHALRSTFCIPCTQGGLRGRGALMHFFLGGLLLQHFSK